MSQNKAQTLTLKGGQSIHVILSPGFNSVAPEVQKTNAIICLSGYGCDHYNFSWINESLGEKYPLVLIDNRGMGKSSHATGDYEIKDLASDAIEVAELLGLDSFHVAGISMGGFIAQELVLAAKDKVKSLVLMCTSSGGEEFIDLPPSTEEGLRAFYALEEPLKSTSVVTATVHPDLPTSHKELFDAIVALRVAHPVEADQAIYQKRAVDKFLAAPLPLEEITMPTLIMSGAEDRYVNPENSKTLNKKIKGSKLILIEKSDHLFFLEKGEEVAREMDQFWKSFN